jgi:hypothetical protein
MTSVVAATVPGSAPAADTRMHSVIHKIGAPFRWIQKGKSRRAWLIYPFIATTLAYVVWAAILASTASEWRPLDTFSIVTGCLFFVVGTSLAVAHERRQEEQEELLGKQRTMLHDQSGMLTRQEGLIERVYRQGQATVARVISLGNELKNLAAETGGKHGLHERAEVVTEPVLQSVHSGSPLINIAEAGKVGEVTAIDLVRDELSSSGTKGEDLQFLQRFALESAIEANAGEAAVEGLFRRSEVYGLGRASRDTSVPGHVAEGAEGDILHFSLEDDDGHEVVFMPIFTRTDVLSDSLERNPEWASLEVLLLNGGDLLDHRDADVTLVIDPWSPFEFQLAPAA